MNPYRAFFLANALLTLQSRLNRPGETRILSSRKISGGGRSLAQQVLFRPLAATTAFFYLVLYFGVPMRLGDEPRSGGSAAIAKHVLLHLTLPLECRGPVLFGGNPLGISRMAETAQSAATALDTISSYSTEAARNASSEAPCGVPRQHSAGRGKGRGPPRFTLAFLTMLTAAVVLLIYRCFHIMNNDSRTAFGSSVRLLSGRRTQMHKVGGNACDAETAADEHANSEGTSGSQQRTEVPAVFPQGEQPSGLDAVEGGAEEAREEVPSALAGEPLEAPEAPMARGSLSPLGDPQETGAEVNLFPAAEGNGNDPDSKSGGGSDRSAAPDEGPQATGSPLNGSESSSEGAGRGPFSPPGDRLEAAAGLSHGSGSDSAWAGHPGAEQMQGEPSFGSVDPEGAVGSTVGTQGVISRPGFNDPIPVWKESGLSRSAVRREKIRRRSSVARHLQEDAKQWVGSVKWEDEVPRDVFPLDDDVFE